MASAHLERGGVVNVNNWPRAAQMQAKRALMIALSAVERTLER
jgi:hypothetical protein